MSRQTPQSRPTRTRGHCGEAQALSDTPQRCVDGLGFRVLCPVAETLSPPNQAGADLRRRPVRTGGNRTTPLKSTKGGPFVKKDIEFSLSRHPPIIVAVCVQGIGIFLGLTECVG